MKGGRYETGYLFIYYIQDVLIFKKKIDILLQQRGKVIYLTRSIRPWPSSVGVALKKAKSH